ncbi:MAG: nuclear transport factor 2 family protein [Methylobacteriaceae bacterium]|nr:nuclear transport factor 2 family protein [Methylobacteriaceae bacterium]
MVAMIGRAWRVAAVCAALSFPAAAPAQTAGLAQPREAADIFVAATAAGDAARIAALYAPDALMVAPGAPPINGREAIAAVFRRNFAAGRNAIAFSRINADIGADRAAIYWEWRAEVGPTAKIAGRSLVYFRKYPEGWLISADMMHIERAPQ